MACLCCCGGIDFRRLRGPLTMSLHNANGSEMWRRDTSVAGEPVVTALDTYRRAAYLGVPGIIANSPSSGDYDPGHGIYSVADGSFSYGYAAETNYRPAWIFQVSAGFIIVSTHTGGTTVRVQKFDQTATVQWTTDITVDSTVGLQRPVVDAGVNTYVAYQSSTVWKLAKLNSSGTVIVTHEASDGSRPGLPPLSLADGTLIVTKDDGGGGTDFYKFSGTNTNEDWMQNSGSIPSTAIFAMHTSRFQFAYQNFLGKTTMGARNVSDGSSNWAQAESGTVGMTAVASFGPDNGERFLLVKSGLRSWSKGVTNLTLDWSDTSVTIQTNTVGSGGPDNEIACDYDDDSVACVVNESSVRRLIIYDRASGTRNIDRNIDDPWPVSTNGGSSFGGIDTDGSKLFIYGDSPGSD